MNRLNEKIIKQRTKCLEHRRVSVTLNDVFIFLRVLTVKLNQEKQSQTTQQNNTDTHTHKHTDGIIRFIYQSSDVLMCHMFLQLPVVQSNK